MRQIVPGDTAILYTAPTRPPERLGRASPGIVVVTAPTPSAAAETAVSLAAQGVRAIELCGATGPLWTAAVAEAVGPRAEVRTVLFGFESLTAAAHYKARTAAGDALALLFLALRPGADPSAERLERQEGATRALFAAVPDADAARALAARLVDEEDVGLIELYGDVLPSTASAVLTAVAGRAPVGVAMSAPRRP